MKRIRNTSKEKAVYFLFAACMLLSLVFSPGCGNKFFDPRQVGRFRPVPAVNVILDSLGVAEEEPSPFDGAENPRPDDILVDDGDYVFNSGDMVMISIYELFQNGILYTSQYVVTETGRISIPEVGAVQAEGLTESQLEEEIRRILEPSILKDPQVTVTLANSQQRTYSISGSGVPIPGRYGIPRYDFRLLEAIATAGGISQFNIDYVYVIRSPQDKAPVEPIHSPRLGELEIIEPGIIEPENIEPENLIEPEQEMLEIIAPRAQKNRYRWPESKVVVTSSEMATDEEFDIVVLPEGFGRINSRRQGWDGVRQVPKVSAGPVDSETMDESIKDEPVSVEDILKTLAEKSRQDNAIESQVGVQNSMKTPAATGLPGEGDTEDEINIDEILKTLSERPSQDRAGERIAPKKVDEQIDVDDILKSFDEPERPGRVDEPLDVEELLKSLDQSESESVSPAETEQEQEKTDIEEMLKTLGRPDEPVMIDEQIGIDDVVEILDTTKGMEPAETETIQDKDETGRIEWIFQDGKWIPVQVGKPKVQKPIIEIETEQQPIVPGPLVRKVVMESEWAPGAQTRVIRIPARKLSAGDPRYNIVIKPGDDIQVPVNVMGEFCIMGNINQQGYINMTGRPMTLKMAIAAAGGLGPLAWPKRCEVVRRISEKKEEIVRVDLDKIASGEQPDFFIKPNDLINVGTHYSAQWRAVLRNAFRATYGFGFLYDRNFAYDDYYSSRRIDLKEAIKIF